MITLGVIGTWQVGAILIMLILPMLAIRLIIRWWHKDKNKYTKNVAEYGAPSEKSEKKFLGLPWS